MWVEYSCRIISDYGHKYRSKRFLKHVSVKTMKTGDCLTTLRVSLTSSGTLCGPQALGRPSLPGLWLPPHTGRRGLSL